MSPTTIRRTLEEIHLLQCSLLPGELLLFTDDAAHWRALLDAYALDPDDPALDDPAAHNTAPAHFQVRLEASSAAWFDVVLPRDYGAIPARGEERVRAAVSVKGDSLGRAEQERWHAAVEEARASVEEGSGSECAHSPIIRRASRHLNIIASLQISTIRGALRAPPPPTARRARGPTGIPTIRRSGLARLRPRRRVRRTGRCSTLARPLRHAPPQEPDQAAPARAVGA